MVSKILKTQLLGLFLLTVLALLSFYYQDSMPDNLYSISSSVKELSAVSYFFTSIVAFVGYYTGPWIFFPFLSFTLFYAFQFSKRDYIFDIFNIFTLCVGFLLAAYIISPTLVGDGVAFLIRENVNYYAIIPACFLFFLSFLIGSYRSTFKDNIFKFFSSINENYVSKILGKPQHPSVYSNNVKRSWKDTLSFFHLKVFRMLKGSQQNQNNEIETQFLSEPDYDSSEIEEIDDVEYESASENLKNLTTDDVEDIPTPNTSVVKRAAMAGEKRKRIDNKKYYGLVSALSGSGKKRQISNPDSIYFEQIIQRIEDKLGEFKIDGNIINILKGPVVDTFELELGPGVKVSRVTSSAEDLSLALYGAPIRIVYPMRGRTTVGIEVPRSPREIIYLDEVLNSKDYSSTNYKLPICMGKDAFGETFVADLAGMPHMLVAGATGAGKSVFINTVLVSLLVKRSPRELKLILIDPKQLELAIYSKLPHLIMPVMTEAKSASIALMWVVQEMERRYSILKEFGVRNLDGYNQKLKVATTEMITRIHPHFEHEEEGEYYLPYIVVIIDEFADLILTKAGKEIENNVCRLAGKARAAGIHLIVATQRPSVDVITGLIKSNFPTRVSFRVTTSVDSRTILNAIGAEKLLGNGDMLYKQGVDTTRVHSSYIDEVEIEHLTAKLSDFENEFNTGAMEFLENDGEYQHDPYSFGSHLSSQGAGNEGLDDLYGEAINVVTEFQSASASMLQRRLKIGYNRAANLIELMESKGVVGPASGSKPRKVLMGPE
jgi:S-DNA-T family DNA segregation ATPase FtsK/SpoIIIE